MLLFVPNIFHLLRNGKTTLQYYSTLLYIILYDIQFYSAVYRHETRRRKYEGQGLLASVSMTLFAVAAFFAKVK